MNGFNDNLNSNNRVSLRWILGFITYLFLVPAFLGLIYGITFVIMSGNTNPSYFWIGFSIGVILGIIIEIIVFREDSEITEDSE